MRVLAVIEVPKLFGRFILHSVRYAALIQAESPTNCDVHLAESVFQTRSGFCAALKNLSGCFFIRWARNLQLHVCTAGR